MEIQLFTDKKYKQLIEERSLFKNYGRCINVSYGLIIGLIIDKTLFYLTKGLSSFIPPFAVMLMGKGKVIKQIRFDKDLGKFEFIVKHFIK